MIERLFWGWDRPVLAAAVQWLTRGQEAGGTLDLADTVLLVPTAEAGRRLRRELALWADARGGAVSVPHVWPPHVALATNEDRAAAASDLEVLLAWTRALERAPAASLTALLPNLPEPEPSWAWRKNLAATLAELQETLGAGGLTMAGVAGSEAAMPGGELARWRDLARLEAVFEKELEQHGRRHPQRLKRQRALEPKLPDGVKRVVVLAAPDLPPLLGDWLQACARSGVAVTVAVQAPEELAAHFDEAGRPLPAFWGEETEIDPGLAEADIHLCSDPAAQAGRAVEWMREAAQAGLPVAVGVCDPEVGPLLKERLEAEGLAVFEPGGTPARQEGLWHLLSLTGELVGEGGWGSFCALARIAEARTAWGLDGGARLLRELDEFSAQHLPGGLEMAKELLDDLPEGWELTRRAVRSALAWRRRFRREPPVEVARDWLIALHGERVFNTEKPGDRERAQLAWAWLEEVEQVTAAARLFEEKPDRQELWSLVMERLTARTLEPARGDVDLVLQGWLELLWESAPALLVAGMNEEFVPGILTGHAFLPDHLRERLGLPCQATRFARDAYLLKALMAARGGAGAGRAGWLCGRWSRQGEARRPSRLLMLCEAERLPGRVRHLFPEKEPEANQAPPPRSLAWVLQPELREPRLETISASRLNRYLRCPFRFYLENVLRMEAVSVPGREMDALAFGNAVHEVLSVFGQDEKARALTDEAAIQAWFEAELREWARRRFGKRPPPLVQLQLESALERLRAQAQVEARERLAGWEIVAAELALGGEDDPAPLLIEGARLTGKVDRIERNSATGERRVIDFKTSEKAGDPMNEHCRRRRSIAAADEWKAFDAPDGSGLLLWTNLQLPLYAAALRGHPSGPVDQVGYGCLPKTLLDTDLRFWDGFDESWEQAALECAAEAVRRIRGGVFWPPAEGSGTGSDLDEFFPGGMAEAARAPALVAGSMNPP